MFASGAGFIWVDTSPGFIRCLSAKILVWPNAVVPVAKDIQVMVELRPHPQPLSHKREREVFELVELLFEGAEQAFYSAVLPRAAGCSALVADAELL